MKLVFICERPTQIITALAVRGHFDERAEVTIIVAKRFDAAEQIVRRFGQVYPGLFFLLTETYKEARDLMESMLPASIFIHWDMGFRTQFWLARLRQKNQGHKIYVYEEGVGTYRQDVYPKVKRWILKALGFPINIGASRYTDEIFVYDKPAYLGNALKQPRKVTQIKQSMGELVAKNMTEWTIIFDAVEFIESLKKSGEGVCKVFLSNFNFSSDEITMLHEGPGVQVLKLHPHCLDIVDVPEVLIAPRSLPAEIFLLVASRAFDEVRVWHHGSSTSQYMRLPNITYHDLASR